MSRRPTSPRPSGRARVFEHEALSPQALLGFALADVTRLLRTIYDARLSGKGLSGASWRVLAYLYREDGLTQTKLAELLEVSRPAIGQMIDRAGSERLRRTSPRSCGSPLLGGLLKSAIACEGGGIPARLARN